MTATVATKPYHVMKLCQQALMSSLFYHQCRTVKILIIVLATLWHFHAQPCVVKIIFSSRTYVKYSFENVKPMLAHGSHILLKLQFLNKIFLKSLPLFNWRIDEYELGKSFFKNSWSKVVFEEDLLSTYAAPNKPPFWSNDTLCGKRTYRLHFDQNSSHCHYKAGAQ